MPAATLSRPRPYSDAADRQAQPRSRWWIPAARFRIRCFVRSTAGASIIRAFKRKSMKKIPRRQSIKMFGALAGLANAPFLSEAAQTAGKASRPNFIVYMSDDHGMLFSEPYGATNIHTPNLA